MSTREKVLLARSKGKLKWHLVPTDVGFAEISMAFFLTLKYCSWECKRYFITSSLIEEIVFLFFPCQKFQSITIQVQ